jgi:dienelactone hydrolase
MKTIAAVLAIAFAFAGISSAQAEVKSEVVEYRHGDVVLEGYLAYDAAVHSFTNPGWGNDNSKGAAYNERADRRSWEAMKAFFAETLK